LKNELYLMLMEKFHLKQGTLSYVIPTNISLLLITVTVLWLVCKEKALS